MKYILILLFAVPIYGATNAEIVSFSGHSINSPVLDVYVKPDRIIAKRAKNKRDLT